MKIAIIGCGNMGMAYAQAFLKSKLCTKQELWLLDKNESRAAELKTEGFEQVGTVHHLLSIREADVVFLSVKPQDFDLLAEQLNGAFVPSQLVISIMAGISLSRIQQRLVHKAVVRAMPNAPAMLGLGATAYSVADAVNFPQLQLVESLLNTTGRSVFLDNENLLDAVTALSGSGPAYFYFIVNAFIEAGITMGLPPAQSQLLVMQTMMGAYSMMQQSDKSPNELIQQVASKGGTTEAALAIWKKNDLDALLKKAILAAKERSKELGSY